MILAATLPGIVVPGADTTSPASRALLDPQVPAPLRHVLENSRPLTHPRGGRLPFLVLPISGALRGVDANTTARALDALAARGIGYTVPWAPGDFEASLAEGLRIARQVRRVGLPIAVDATACLDGFYDGSPETLHVDARGMPFADLSFDPGRPIGCPLAVLPRIPAMRARLERFLDAYAAAGLLPDLVFADWEIDGPLDGNDAWAAAQRCQRCRAGLTHLEDFRQFQRQVRTVRSQLQREAFAEPVRRRNPAALVGNYAVHPHGGFRYWYDYFEKIPPAPGVPVLWEGRAPYREWPHEFADCGYTLGLPVIYTWYPIHGWSDFANSDARWFYHLLREGSNVGGHGAPDRPQLPFIHRHTTAPPPTPSPEVKEFSVDAYQELLWHLLLRGHDGFFIWCLPNELADEVRSAHAVYAEALEQADILTQGTPVVWEVPRIPGPVISARRWGNRVLIRRTDPGAAGHDVAVPLRIAGRMLAVPFVGPRCQVLTLPEE